MAVLKVRRGSPGKRDLLLQGKWLPIGTEFDTRDFPRVSKLPGKWAQLIRLGILYDDHLDDPGLLDELRKQREEFGASPVVESRPEPDVPIPLEPEDVARLDKPTVLQCGECGHQATSAHGLKVHVGKRHKKE